MTALEEYRAGTNPIDPNSNLRITAFSVTAGGSNAVVTWTTSPTRFYLLHERSGFSTNSAWFDRGLGMISPGVGPTTTRALSGAAAAQHYFRVEAVAPLSP